MADENDTPPAADPTPAFSPEQEQRIGEIIGQALKDAGIGVDAKTDVDAGAPAMMKQFGEMLDKHTKAVEAKLTTVLGKKLPPTNGSDGSSTQDGTGKATIPFVAKLRAATGAGVSQGAAIMDLKRKHPKEFNDWHTSGRPI